MIHQNLTRYIMPLVILSLVACSNAMHTKHAYHKPDNRFKKILLSEVQKELYNSHIAYEDQRFIETHLIGVLRNHDIAQLHDRNNSLRYDVITFQSLMESSLLDLLQHHAIKSLRVIIHTPHPSNALGIFISTPLLRPQYNPIRKIMEKRVDKLREMARADCNLKLIIAYPNSFLESCEPNERQAYKHALNNPKAINLENLPLYCEYIPKSLQGATYLFQTRNNVTLAFSINGSQFDPTLKVADWRFWLGDLHSRKVSSHIIRVHRYLGACQHNLGNSMKDFQTTF